MNPNVFQTRAVPRTDEIRALLAERIDRQKQAIGAVIGVIDPTGRHISACGTFANGDPRTVDGDTIFEIGSITKVFTSLILADMVTRNEVALADPAAKYLPQTVAMPGRNGKSITLLDLSTHTSGLPRIPGNLKLKNPANPYAGYTVQDLYSFLASYALPRDPGSEVEYSNLGAGLLGHLLARRAEMDFETLIATRLTRPLNMSDTRITLSSAMERRMATGHNASLAPVSNWDFPALAGAGALRSSANDLLTFLAAFLGYTESPLTTAMRAMLEIRRPVGKQKFEIALGWHLLGDIAWHDGGTGGFRSLIGFDPKARIGVVALSNTSTPAGIDDIAMHLLNPTVPLANPEPPKERTAIQLSPDLLDTCVGRYQLAQDRIVEITREGDRLFLQVTTFATGQAIAGPRFEMFPESEKEWFVRLTGSRIAFETGPDGLVTSLMMHRAGREVTHALRLSSTGASQLQK